MLDNKAVSVPEALGRKLLTSRPLYHLKDLRYRKKGEGTRHGPNTELYPAACELGLRQPPGGPVLGTPPEPTADGEGGSLGLS